MGNIFTDLFSSDDAEKAAKDAAAGYTTGATNANNTLSGAQTTADQLYQQAYSPFTSLITSTGQGSQAYADATGVNGAEGLARAKAIYQADPGYSGGLTTGIDQVNRTAAQRGQLAGGNTSADEIKFASDYDANKYGSYVSSLAPYLGANQSAISGAAGVLGNQATTDSALSGQQAQNTYNASVGAGNATAQGDMAPYQASSNFWSALTGLGGLALKATGVGGFAPTAARA